MPVIVVGADTPTGQAVAAELLARRGEVRVFVTDPEVGLALRERGAKVAIGDVSDASHVGGAALNAFSAVLVATAARDARERSFACTPEAVLAAWVEGLQTAGVRRAIWVGVEAEPELQEATPEAAFVPADRPAADVAADVARLDEAAEI